MRDDTDHRPRAARLLALGLVVLLVAAGCAGGDSDEGGHGGAGDLPGPVPEGVSFAEPPEEAVPAPDFSTELLDGTPVTASDLWDDRPVVLVFTASWCETCRGVHRDAAAAVEEHGDAVALLGVVGADDAEGARDYAEELELGHPIAVAEERVWLDYAVREPPLVALVAPGGKVLRGWPGGVGRDVLAGQLGELVEGSGGR